jgi:hypothetical protein
LSLLAVRGTLRSGSIVDKGCRLTSVGGEEGLALDDDSVVFGLTSELELSPFGEDAFGSGLTSPAAGEGALEDPAINQHETKPYVLYWV